MNKTLLNETNGSVHRNRNETFYIMELSYSDYPMHSGTKYANLYFIFVAIKLVIFLQII